MRKEVKERELKGVNGWAVLVAAVVAMLGGLALAI